KLRLLAVRGIRRLRDGRAGRTKRLVEVADRLGIQHVEGPLDQRHLQDFRPLLPRPRWRTGLLVCSFRRGREGVTAGRLDPYLPRLPRHLTERALDTADVGRFLTTLMLEIIAYRKADYQSVWPGNCWTFRLFQVAGEKPSHLVKNSGPHPGHSFGNEGS